MIWTYFPRSFTLELQIIFFSEYHNDSEYGLDKYNIW